GRTTCPSRTGGSSPPTRSRRTRRRSGRRGCAGCRRPARPRVRRARPSSRGRSGASSWLFLPIADVRSRMFSIYAADLCDRVGAVKLPAFQFDVLLHGYRDIVVVVVDVDVAVAADWAGGQDATTNPRV